MVDPSPSGSSPGSFLEELKRRHVVKVAVAYAAAGWIVLQLAGLVLPTFGAPAWVLKVLVGLVALLFPIALVLAWAFEITPEGVRRTQPARSPAARPATQQRRVGGTLNKITIAVLAVAVAILGWERFAHPGAGERPQAASTAEQPAADGGPVGGSGMDSSRSIAVLPFVNASGDSSNQYFSDGLSEDLIVALGQLPGLRVIGRESSFQFRGRDLDSKQIGQKLGVGHLLEGSVSRDAGQVRVRAELVNAADGSMLWSQRYDRPYQNLFALQDDLTDAVATALEARLLTRKDSAAATALQGDRPPGGSLDAYNAYLQGSYYSAQYNRESLPRAIDAYRQAVRLDPRYAAAFAAMSRAWSWMSAGFLGGAEARAAYDSARWAADTALALQPDLASAHDARGLLLQTQMDWKGSEVELRRAYQLAPGDPSVQRHMAVALATSGRIEKAVEIQRKELAHNPLDAGGYLVLSTFLAGLGRSDEAADAAKRAIAIQPAAASLHTTLTIAEVLRGDTAAALDAAEHEPDPSWTRQALALANAAAGDRTRADAALEQMIAKDAALAAFQIADVYAFRREPDRAFEWLDRAWKQRDPGISGLLYDPFLLRYRKDPRFAAFCRKVGLPAPGDAPEATASASRS